MSEIDYVDLINSTKTNNLAMERTNICIEALERKLRLNAEECKSYFRSNSKNELLLIFLNYLVQKYCLSQGIYADAEMGQRIFFKIYSDGELVDIAGAISMNKARWYLADYIVKNSSIITGIMSYGICGFEKAEEQIINKSRELHNINISSKNAEMTMNIYQIITVGACIGYFDVILDYTKLSIKEKNFVQKYEDNHYVIKILSDFYLINKFTGELISFNSSKIKYGEWCNHDILKGLKYLTDKYK